MALPKLTVPKYELVVPSTGEVIKYRPYLVKEEKVLMMAIESKDQNQMLNALKDVISGCTEGKVKPDKLKAFDLEYIFIKLRCKSVGENANIMVKCMINSCETKNELTIPLDEIAVKGEMIQEFNLKLSEDVGMILKYPNIKDIQKGLTLKDNNQDIGFATIVNMIESIYDADNVYPASSETQQSLTDFIDSLSSDQFKKIHEFVSKMPKVTYNATFKCNKCKETNDIMLEGLQNFF